MFNEAVTTAEFAAFTHAFGTIFSIISFITTNHSMQNVKKFYSCGKNYLKNVMDSQSLVMGPANYIYMP
jgi:hypothetical protein